MALCTKWSIDMRSPLAEFINVISVMHLRDEIAGKSDEKFQMTGANRWKLMQRKAERRGDWVCNFVALELELVSPTWPSHYNHLTAPADLGFKGEKVKGRSALVLKE